MAMADIIPDLPYSTVRIALAGRGRWSLRWAMGDCLAVAVALGQTVRNFVRARKQRANDSDASVPQDADAGQVATLLSRAFAWAAYLSNRLYVEAGGKRRRGAAGAGAEPDVPLNAVLGMDIGMPDSGTAQADTRSDDDIAAAATLAMERKLQRAQARAERTAMLAMLGRMPVPAIVRQICEDLHQAATLLGQGAAAERVEAVAARVGAMFTAAADIVRQHASRITYAGAPRPRPPRPDEAAPAPDTG